ncbi:EamA family transporter [Clostridium butyricum]|uniref:EamA family transporter n=1 Tax=Clostridium butyricum TaxID=1492 RepID=UPI0030014846
MEASSCSLFYPLQPMISALLGSLLLGEIINLRFISGALLIIFGIIYIVFSDSRQPLTKNIKHTLYKGIFIQNML